MKYEKEYIEYLIENVLSIDTNLIDMYLLDKLNFDELIEKIDVTRYGVMSFTTFVKSKKLDNLLN